jgi:hypothetical protein
MVTSLETATFLKLEMFPGQTQSSDRCQIFPSFGRQKTLNEMLREPKADRSGTKGYG